MSAEQNPPLLESYLQVQFRENLDAIKHNLELQTDYFIGDGNLVPERIKSLRDNDSDTFNRNLFMLSSANGTLKLALKNMFRTDQTIYRTLPESLRNTTRSLMERTDELLTKISNIINPLGGNRRSNKQSNRRSNRRTTTNKKRKSAKKRRSIRRNRK